MLASRCNSVLLATAFVAAIAINSATADDTGVNAGENNDPLEGVNRVTSEFNKVVRGAIIDPLVDGYQAITPEPVQEGVSNIFSNLSEPVTAVSSLLQGDTENAGTATSRFLINTTIGLGGISDEATGMGYEQRREDLGQAMGANGMESGPHIVLPIFGPSNLRDATGDIVTGLISPAPLALKAADGGVQYSDNQDEIKALGDGAVDPYIAEREAYEQHRSFLVNNGEQDSADFPSFASEPPPSVADKPN